MTQSIVGTVAQKITGVAFGQKSRPEAVFLKYFSDLVLINDGPDTIDPLNTDLELHEPLGTYFLCHAPHEMGSRRHLTSSEVQPVFYLVENVLVVVTKSPPSMPPPSRLLYSSCPTSANVAFPFAVAVAPSVTPSLPFHHLPLLPFLLRHRRFHRPYPFLHSPASAHVHRD